MNIYRYIPSPDIGAHCAQIGHIFNPLEMAVIVANSERPMLEKHAAWREIITDYPDMPIRESNGFDARDSLHEYLRELIAYEKTLMDAFYTPGDGAVYRDQVLWQDEWCSRYGGCYSTVENAWAGVCDSWDLAEDLITKVQIDRVQFDSGDHIQGLMNADGELLYLTLIGSKPGVEILPDAHPDDLEMIFIHLPVPFKRGDLVMFADGQPLVLESIPHWWNDGLRYADRVSGKLGDGSDMIVYGYALGKDGELYRNHLMGLWGLRYYTGKLEGRDRFLKYLSQFIKAADKEKYIDWLINLYLKFDTGAKSYGLNHYCWDLASATGSEDTGDAG